jgi:pantothenate kinase-related protein Tda10
MHMNGGPLGPRRVSMSTDLISVALAMSASDHVWQELSSQEQVLLFGQLLDAYNGLWERVDSLVHNVALSDSDRVEGLRWAEAYWPRLRP